MQIAGRSIQDPLSALDDYLRCHPQTVTCFDLASPGDPNRLIEAEVWRTHIIRSRISRNEMAWFVEVGHRAPWRDVPENTTLVAADPYTPSGRLLYERASALWRVFWASTRADQRVATAKISKVLHVKRPHLIPLLDSRLVRCYRTAAAKAT